MHAVNHPRTRHLCGDVWDVNPRGACGGRPVALLWLSPDCTYHSKARGGKPFRDPKSAKGRRGLAWVAVRWAREVRPRVICLENVEEFQDWGPLDGDGRPDPLRRGLTFRRWKGSLEAAGYVVEMRELRACDYGAPTIRKRLFVIARCDGLPIIWPEPTHGLRRAEPHRPAAECIEWSIPCPSIFDRKKPLAEKTLARIARGVMRYVVEAAEPFIVPVTHGGRTTPRRIRSARRSARSPGAHRGELALVAPSLLRTDMHQSNAGCVYAPHEPLRTITTGGGHALVGATLINTRSQGALVSAFLAKYYGGHETPGASLARPFSTVTTIDHHALVTSAMVPMPTVRAGGTRLAEVRAFLTKYYGAESTVGQPLQLSLGTVTTRDRFGLVMVRGESYEIADIGMRMLVPRELFRAQGLPDSYVIDPIVDGKPLSKTAQVRMCGNSVPPHVAAAIVAANVGAGSASANGRSTRARESRDG